MVRGSTRSFGVFCRELMGARGSWRIDAKSESEGLFGNFSKKIPKQRMKFVT
jgi:hypothetical protein